jgi:2,3-bisphosphoglycerate-dependent phosphoglycerate mutase
MKMVYTKANEAGKILKANRIEFDEAHVSLLKRAVRTLTEALHSSDQHWIPIKHSWRLNERHYGALTGLSKKEAVTQFCFEQILGMLMFHHPDFTIF